jgi:lipoprotein-anchoring transpeptidase ErfK/SrfK
VSKHGLSTPMVGNDFFVARPRLQTAGTAPAAVPKPVISIPVAPDTGVYSFPVAVRTVRPVKHPPALLRYAQHGLDTMHRYSVGAFALLFLLVGSSGIQVWAGHASAAIAASAPNIKVQHREPIAGLNTHIPAGQLDTKLKAVTGQHIAIVMGTKTETIVPEAIRNWMSIVTNKAQATSYIHVKEATIVASLQEVAKKHTKTPVNQIVVEHGGTSQVISTGVDGVKIGDTTAIAKEIGKHLLAGSGMSFSVPTETVPFASVTPTSFSKLIEVNVVSKQMYLYENGQMVRQYPISAGAPETPTPIGQFKIQYKLAKQDMRGYNANGTKYFQPNVKWISYFKEGGFAIHGNYWRPASWFGVRNSSHGCVSLPDYQAKQVYEWAPTGTTIVTHT